MKTLQNNVTKKGDEITKLINSAFVSMLISVGVVIAECDGADAMELDAIAAAVDQVTNGAWGYDDVFGEIVDQIQLGGTVESMCRLVTPYRGHVNAAVIIMSMAIAVIEADGRVSSEEVATMEQLCDALGCERLAFDLPIEKK